LQMMQILHLINRLTQHLAHAAAATVGWMLLSLTSFRSRSTSMFARVVVAPCASHQSPFCSFSETALSQIHHANLTLLQFLPHPHIRSSSIRRSVRSLSHDRSQHRPLPRTSCTRMCNSS
jgi:hypothetical protein